MRPFTPASPPSRPRVEPSRLPRDLLLTALAFGIVASAIVVPLEPVFAMGLALVAAFVLCRVASQHLQRVLIVTMTTVIMLALGAFDEDRNFSARRAVSPDGSTVTWLITVNGALHLFVEPLPVRALVGDKRGAIGTFDRDVESARVVWAKDSSSFIVVGKPKTRSLWARGRLAWDDDHVLGRFDPLMPWKWEPLPAWSARAPEWLAHLARQSYVEPIVLASTMETTARMYLIPAAPAAPPALDAIDVSRRSALFPFGNVDDVRVIQTTGRAKSLVVGKPRWHLLWAEGRLVTGEHVLAHQDAATLEWSVLDPWSTKTPSWLRALHADDEDELHFDVPFREKARLCNCTP